MARPVEVLMDRFEAKVLRTDTCWIWLASRDRGGYGKLKVCGLVARAHRVAYELFVGPIPEGLTLDHLCSNRACVNPVHLEPVDGIENIKRGARRRRAAQISEEKPMPNHEYFTHYGIECTTHSTHSAYLYDGDYPGACLARHYRDEDRVESNLDRVWGQL